MKTLRGISRFIIEFAKISWMPLQTMTWPRICAECFENWFLFIIVHELEGQLIQVSWIKFIVFFKKDIHSNDTKTYDSSALKVASSFYGCYHFEDENTLIVQSVILMEQSSLYSTPQVSTPGLLAWIEYVTGFMETVTNRILEVTR